MMKNEKVSQISLLTGIIAIGALGAAFILPFLYPIPPHNLSALYSPAGPIIFVSVMASFFLGPVALFTGISGIRQISKGILPREKKKIAVIGTIFGVTVSSLFLYGFILVFFKLFRVFLTGGIK
jgi:hypothetical protein